MSLAASERAPETTSAVVLRGLLHDLAQPVTALECSFEIEWSRRSQADVQRHELEDRLEATSQIRNGLEFARKVADADQPCECRRDVPIRPLLLVAVDELRELAQSMDVQLERDCEDLCVYGNPDKIREAMRLLMDWAVARRQACCLRFAIDGNLAGSVRVVASPCAGVLMSHNDAERSFQLAAVMLEATRARVRRAGPSKTDVIVDFVSSSPRG